MMDFSLILSDLIFNLYMQNYIGVVKTLTRSVRMLRVDPAKSEAIKAHNLKALESRLGPMQLKKVEFIADKIFELNSLELAFIKKRLSERTNFSEKYGMISFDRFKAARLRNGEFNRKK